MAEKAADVKDSLFFSKTSGIEAEVAKDRYVDEKLQDCEDSPVHESVDGFVPPTDEEMYSEKTKALMLSKAPRPVAS